MDLLDSTTMTDPPKPSMLKSMKSADWMTKKTRKFERAHKFSRNEAIENKCWQKQLFQTSDNKNVQQQNYYNEWHKHIAD